MWLPASCRPQRAQVTTARELYKRPSFPQTQIVSPPLAAECLSLCLLGAHLLSRGTERYTRCSWGTANILKFFPWFVCLPYLLLPVPGIVRIKACSSLIHGWPVPLCSPRSSGQHSV